VVRNICAFSVRYGTCVMSPFWRLQFGDGYHIFLKVGDTSISPTSW